MDAFLPTSDACADTERLIQAVFDRERPIAALQNEHGRVCADCRRQIQDAVWLLTALDQFAEARDVSLTVNFADRVVPLIQADQLSVRRASRLRRIVTACTLAASIALAVVLVRERFVTTLPVSGTPELAVATAPSLPADPPILVSAELTAMRDTLANLTRRTAEEALAPAQSLLPDSLTEPAVPPVPLTPTADSVATLADVPEAARSGLEPLTGSAERAWNLFLRDVGLTHSPKPKS